MEINGRANIKMYNQDCMKALQDMDENQFDLAIVDPPYGKDIIKTGKVGGDNKGIAFTNYGSNDWDKNTPSKEYFNELFRVSKNQIIFGSNYFELPPTRCNIIWDKMQKFSGADFELAWTSFDKASKAFRMSRVEAYSAGKIHPTQKPIKLYEWLLMNYAEKGNKILDTHLGSGSIAIACHNLDFPLIACELNPFFYKEAVERLKKHQMQIRMF